MKIGNSMFVAALGVFTAIVFASSRLHYSHLHEKAAPKQTPATVQKEAVDKALRDLHMDRPYPADAMTLKSSWRKDGFDTVMIADLAIKNGNDYPVKDIRVSCMLTANSGTGLGTADATVYEIVPAKSTKMFRDVNMGFIHGQVQRAGCEIKDAVAM